jgi:hypothetical protein
MVRALAGNREVGAGLLLPFPAGSPAPDHGTRSTTSQNRPPATLVFISLIAQPLLTHRPKSPASDADSLHR